MKLHNMLPFRSRAIGLALLSLSAPVFADLSQLYCSSQNTGSDFAVVNSIYQSNGLCFTTCNSQSYAFAIIQYQNCWCSNYIPADQDSTSKCSQNCPGYPQEQCGNKNDGYFGYVQLPHPASGTAGASSAVASSSNSPSPSSSPQQSTSQEAATSYTSSTTSTTSTTSSSPSSTQHPTSPVTSVVLSTISGAVVTQFVTATPSAAPSASASTDDAPIEEQHHGLGGGAIAGIVIGVLAGIALLAAAAFFLWRRRRGNGTDPENSVSGSRKGMTRNVSVLSKAGLLSLGNRPSMGERDRDDMYVAPATGQNSVRHSMLFTGVDGVEATSPLDSSHSNDSGKSARAMVYDQRLNPSALFANHENGSRVSIQDQQDYSRPLGVMNPDPPRASFDSRISHN